MCFTDSFRANIDVYKRQLHNQGTKNGAVQKAFADVSFLDAKYTESLSDKVTVNTAIDALTHLIELSLIHIYPLVSLLIHL